MICKMVFGANFKGCLDYITGRYEKDKHAEIVAHSEGIPNLSNNALTQIFEAYSQKGGHNIEHPVAHFAYSFHKNDSCRLSNYLMVKIAREHMELMSIKDTEFIMTRHHDTKHDHLHLMFSMVDRNGDVINDSMWRARNKRICKFLTKKYGLTMSSEKDKVNRNKLRGKEKLKYEFYDKVMRSKASSDTWDAFRKSLQTEGLDFRFHYNNVTGKILGITFTDGKCSFSGRQLDKELTLPSLNSKFGDLKQLTHDSVCDWYEQYKSRLIGYNNLSGCKALDVAYPDIEDLFPDGEIPQLKYLPVKDLFSEMSNEEQMNLEREHTLSEDKKTSFIGLSLLCKVLLQPYELQLSIGGGGGPNNNRGWRDLDDDEKKNYSFRFNFTPSKGNRGRSKKPLYSFKR